MKLKKYLLGSALFLVVSLCSLTLAYADNGVVTGSVMTDLQLSYPYFNSFQGVDSEFIAPYTYDFPITTPKDFWRYTSYSGEKQFTVGFDRPVYNGLFYFEGIDLYQRWSGVTDCLVRFADGSVYDATSLVSFNQGSSNTFSFTLDCNKVVVNSNGSGIIYILFGFSGGSVHTELKCNYCNFIPEPDHLFHDLAFTWGTPDNHKLNMTYETLLLLCDIFNNTDYLYATRFSNNTFMVAYNEPIRFVHIVERNGYYYLVGYRNNVSTPDLVNLGLYLNGSVSYFSAPVSSNYDYQNYLSLQELIDIMGGSGQGVQQEVEQAQQAITDVDDALTEQEDLEHAWQGSMTSNFNALAVSSFDFDTDTASGLTLVGSVFSSLWNSMGKWSVLYSFPLLLGVVLLLIGRISRHDKKERREQSKSNKK